MFLGRKHVLKDITFSLPISGEIIGIVGPNGAEKSSLLEAFIGEFKATGEQTLYDRPIHTQLRYITYIPQKAHIDLDFPIKVGQVILSGCYQDIGWFKRPEMVKKAKLNQLLKDLELNDLRHRQIAELSCGQLQRVLVARALMSDSDIYCFDEPFVGIDIYSEKLIMNKIKHLKHLGKLILIVHHDLSKAYQYFDRILLLNQSLQFLWPTKEALTSKRLNATFMNYTDDSLLNSSSQGSAS
ncbi:metal ABC transporter ATP-binding protein [Staphylococcus saccharolyticus]|uniref:metal ABC transporter ATP-binding protein n=1 Tax=Staphylococcus saccharolyticus TaxID=33028 RepID=UPI00102DC3BF|nr:metal ABC transporter ATP-binding protein [Staphylococcus saccharolyticus]MBL7572648.1 metal ABC transporter ATP-binding protein [Staphylococcus saccharolyticus]MBL7584771.1 metal ABC transporter ATP-binding protein [Staphylococcus saccharolyticus]MBL7638264.1 metal ABC transporter ATP-binding protein [Staphylococcus saccharolyticus]QRJ68224.1 metal ABC transporter ATP-binding protein [Staphylococcus saccharolyticus]TAA93189.1 metal ABC transporter ATP-binding protein [Staphylococcus saccha